MNGPHGRGVESSPRGATRGGALGVPLAPRQDDLFASLGPEIDDGFATARRIELDETSWLEFVPGWLRAGGGHSTSWHGDAIGKVQQTSIVPVLSLGATRRFLIRPAHGGPSVSLNVASGDLVVMGGRSQRDWRHSVPKQHTPAGPRISVNFAPKLRAP